MYISRHKCKTIRLSDFWWAISAELRSGAFWSLHIDKQLRKQGAETPFYETCGQKWL